MTISAATLSSETPYLVAISARSESADVPRMYTSKMNAIRSRVDLAALSAFFCGPVNSERRASATVTAARSWGNSMPVSKSATSRCPWIITENSRLRNPPAWSITVELFFTSAAPLSFASAAA